MTRRQLLRAGLLGVAIMVVASCGDPAPLSTDRPGRAARPDLGSPLPTGLLACTPLPYDSVTQAVGPDGGTIGVGPHVLTIPAGALDSVVTITAVAPSDTVNAVRFQPAGLTFQQPAQLAMSYANCNLLGIIPIPRQIAYTSDVLAILYYLESVDNPPSQTVTGQVSHFSEYAVAW